LNSGIVIIRNRWLTLVHHAIVARAEVDNTECTAAWERADKQVERVLRKLDSPTGHAPTPIEDKNKVEVGAFAAHGLLGLLVLHHLEEVLRLDRVERRHHGDSHGHLCCVGASRILQQGHHHVSCAIAQLYRFGDL